MLKGIDPLLVPELLAALAEMGHGDVIAVVDRNFPAHTDGGVVIELPAAGVVEAIGAVLSLMPLDQWVEHPVLHMLTDEGADGPAAAPVKALCDDIEGREVGFRGLLRHEGFYEQAAEAYVTVRTGETLPFACFLLKKGTV